MRFDVKDAQSLAEAEELATEDGDRIVIYVDGKEAIYMRLGRGQTKINALAIARKSLGL